MTDDLREAIAKLFDPRAWQGNPETLNNREDYLSFVYWQSRRRKACDKMDELSALLAERGLKIVGRPANAKTSWLAQDVRERIAIQKHFDALPPYPGAPEAVSDE